MAGSDDDNKAADKDAVKEEDAVQEGETKKTSSENATSTSKEADKSADSEKTTDSEAKEDESAEDDKDIAAENDTTTEKNRTTDQEAAEEDHATEKDASKEDEKKADEDSKSDDDDDDDDDNSKKPPSTPATKKKKGGDDDDDDDEGLDSSSKRRFFPRVKHLLTKEWAYFLSGVLDALEHSGACVTAAASHKATNPWFRAFDLVYGGIAAECSIPTGKNRYHKFKDKIVELWTAMETQAPDDHPLKERAVNQLNEYRNACEEQQVLILKHKDDFKNIAPSAKMLAEKSHLPPGAGSAAALGKQPSIPPQPPAVTPTGTKRPYSSMIPSSGSPWKHLDEKEAISKIPQPLQNLLHLRHLQTELKAKSMVEISFQKALNEYVKRKCDRDQLYDRALTLAYLFRQAQSPKESKEVLQAYELAVREYLTMIDPTTTQA